MALSYNEDGEAIRIPKKCIHEPLQLYCLDCSRSQEDEIIHPDLTKNSSFNRK